MLYRGLILLSKLIHNTGMHAIQTSSKGGQLVYILVIAYSLSDKTIHFLQ